MSTEPTLEEALETIVEQAQEIERLKNLVSTVKGAANDLCRCLAAFGDRGNWVLALESTQEYLIWKWIDNTQANAPAEVARRALERYDAALKQWDAEHPTGVERLRQ